MSQNFNITDFAKEVIYDLRSVEGRRTFIYDYGCGHVTDEQQAVIQSMVDEGTWDREAFNNALVYANRQFADDLLEGNIDRASLPEGERDIFEAMQAVRETGNEDLIDSAKEFFRVTLEQEINSPNAQFNKPRNFSTSGYDNPDDVHYIIMTEASWTGNAQARAHAIERGLQGDFSDGRNYLGLDSMIDRKPYDADERVFKMAAKAFRAEAKEHIVATSPKADAEATQKTGLSAAAQASQFQM